MSLLRFLDRRRNALDSAWTVSAADRAEATSRKEYYPLVDTLRLYAGWLMAWYFVIYALGTYQFLRELPFKSDVLSQFFSSGLVLQFSSASFLFLLLSEIHSRLGRGIMKGILLTLAGLFFFALFRANI